MAMKRVNVQPLLSQAVLEIDTILAKYFDPTPLSKTYFPKAVRSFCTRLLSCVSESETLLKIVHCSTEQIANCINALNAPNYLPVAVKRMVESILRDIRLFQPNSFKVPREEQVISNDALLWPVDVGTVEDLMASVYKKDLRVDIENYVFAFLEQCVPHGPDGQIYKFTYEPNRTLKPIVVRVLPSTLHAVTAYLVSLSKHCPTTELKPEDCIQVDSLEEGDEVGQDIVQEGMITSGCPYRSGTIGCIMSIRPDEENAASATDDQVSTVDAIAEKDMCALTCQHVNNSLLVMTNFELAGDVLFKARDSKVDVALFKLVNFDADKTFNIMRYKCADHEFAPKIGEDVYKMGAHTGLTTGTLSHISTYFTCASEARRYSNVVEVEWHADDIFAHSGDCGSLYAVKRGNFYIPIAIHVASGRNRSYGCSFLSTMECISDGTRVAGFVNAPQAGKK